MINAARPRRHRPLHLFPVLTMVLSRSERAPLVTDAIPGEFGGGTVPTRGQVLAICLIGAPLVLAALSRHAIRAPGWAERGLGDSWLDHRLRNIAGRLGRCAMEMLRPHRTRTRRIRGPQSAAPSTGSGANDRRSFRAGLQRGKAIANLVEPIQLFPRRVACSEDWRARTSWRFCSMILYSPCRSLVAAS